MRFDVQMPEGVEMITQDRGLYVADLVHTVIGFECLLLAESGHSRACSQRKFGHLEVFGHLSVR
jgi:hypothetical protein